MIEFDVCAVRGRLGIAHNPLEGRLEPYLEAGLAHLAADRFEGVELNVDLGERGVEDGALDALRRHDLLGRALISSRASRARPRARARARRPYRPVRRHKPQRRLTGLRDWSRFVAEALAAGRFNALMAHHKLVDRELVERVKDTGAEVYADVRRAVADRAPDGP